VIKEWSWDVVWILKEQEQKSKEPKEGVAGRVVRGCSFLMPRAKLRVDHRSILQQLTCALQSLIGARRSSLLSRESRERLLCSSAHFDLPVISSRCFLKKRKNEKERRQKIHEWNANEVPN
jgi:hypothetical protein